MEGWLDAVRCALGSPGPLVVARRFPSRNVVWLLAGIEPPLVLKAMPDSAAVRQRLSWEAVLLEHLVSQGCAVAASPMALRDPVALPGGWIGQVTTAVLGRPLRPVPSDLRRLGASLAALHAASVGLADCERAPRLGAEELVWSPARVLATEIGARPAFGALVQRLGEWLARLPSSADAMLPCHGDAHHENTLLDPDGTVYWIDFELCAVGWPAYDLATAIWATFAQPRGGHLWQALIEGYGAVRLLTSEEAGWLRAFIVVRHLWWLRFQVEHGAGGGVPVRSGADFLLYLAEQVGVDEIIRKPSRAR